ncbi:MAG TPA: LysR family transcriptional regulator [Steroidobacteraceae bacterium]|nr:LysR family transcriptional regulator [Steroidobacteraceae bacterium]
MIGISLKQIEYFRAVMEAGTVSGAAELLSVSQPNVSRMLKYTEGRLGIRLFERSKGRLQPTAEARALYREVQSLHAHLESLQDTVRHIARGELGRFTVGASPSLGRHVLPTALSSLRREFPQLAVKLDILSVSQVIEYVTLNQGECACTIFPISHPQIETQAYAAGALVCAVPRDHPLAKRSLIGPKDLAAETLIGFEPNTPHGRVMHDFLRQTGHEPVYVCTARFAETACALAEQGNGIALVDEFTVSGNVFPNLVALPTKWRKPFRIYLHRATERPLSRIGERLGELLAAWGSGEP